MTLSAVKVRSIEMAENITRKQIKDINFTVAYPITSDIKLMALFC